MKVNYTQWQIWETYYYWAVLKTLVVVSLFKFLEIGLTPLILALIVVFSLIHTTKPYDEGYSTRRKVQVVLATEEIKSYKQFSVHSVVLFIVLFAVFSFIFNVIISALLIYVLSAKIAMIYFFVSLVYIVITTHKVYKEVNRE